MVLSQASSSSSQRCSSAENPEFIHVCHTESVQSYLLVLSRRQGSYCRRSHDAAAATTTGRA